MAIKSNVFIIPLVLFLVFVGFGDKFLPNPLNTASLQTRITLNKWIMGLFPERDGDGINPNKEREAQIEQMENAR